MIINISIKDFNKILEYVFICVSVRLYCALLFMFSKKILTMWISVNSPQLVFLYFQTLVCMLNLVISSKIWSGFNFEISLASIKERTREAFLRPTWEYASLVWDTHHTETHRQNSWGIKTGSPFCAVYNKPDGFCGRLAPCLLTCALSLPQHLKWWT